MKTGLGIGYGTQNFVPISVKVYDISMPSW